MVRCLAFGLLLARFGLLSISRGKVTVARLFNSIIVPIRRAYFRRSTLYLRTIIVIADIYWGLYSPAIQSEDHITPRT